MVVRHAAEARPVLTGAMSVSETQPGLALVDDGDALPRRIDYLRSEAGRGRVNVHGEGFYADPTSSCTRAERRST